MSKNTWGPAPYTVYTSEGARACVVVTGRERWALECLMAAGAKGCTPIELPAPRWSAYIHDLRGFGIEIETISEPHGGPFSGSHARYVLRPHVSRAEPDRRPA